MIGVNIRIQDKKNADQGLFPEIAQAGFEEGVLESVGILEAGTVSGKPSIGINIKMPDGTYIIAQSTLALLEGIVSAARGAQERWNEAR